MKAHLLSDPLDIVIKKTVNPETKKRDGKWWCTVKDVFYRLPNGKIDSVEAGFVTDGASVPKIARCIVDVFDQILPAALLHDKYYCEVYSHDFTRKQIDKIFYDLMRQNGVRWLEANLAYYAVRMFGWLAFKKNRPSYDKLSSHIICGICEDNGYTRPYKKDENYEKTSITNLPRSIVK